MTNLIRHEDGSISFTQWLKRGGMLVNREALDFDDPEHPYNLVLDAGLNPEDYGLSHPRVDEFKDKTRDELIREIVELRKDIVGFHRISAMWG